MFTGIVEEIGHIRRIQRGELWIALEISAKKVLLGVKLGDSIAVNGTCLTVTSFTASTFTVDVMPETMKKTSLVSLGIGSPVNLERAMAAGDRFGGHFVSGHVDGTGIIKGKKPYGNAVLVIIEASEDILRYVIPKGSVSIDGISLTVVDTDSSTLTVSIIPHTLQETVLKYKNSGDVVNLECDMIGKYIERFILLRENKDKKKSSSLTEEFLIDNGFM
jgi:riboflavin synthase